MVLFIGFVIGSLWLAAMSFAFYALWLDQKKPRRSSPRRPVKRRRTASNHRPRLEGRLVELLGGDAQTAYRLVTSVKTSNPQRSDRWCIEKALYDLERDRR